MLARALSTFVISTIKDKTQCNCGEDREVAVNGQLKKQWTGECDVTDDYSDPRASCASFPINYYYIATAVSLQLLKLLQAVISRLQGCTCSVEVQSCKESILH